MKKLLILLFLSTSLFALSKQQHENAKIIYKVAKPLNYEHSLLKIAIQESSLGINNLGDFKKGTDITKASLGVFQFQIATVRHLQKCFPKRLRWLAHYSDHKLAQRLISDVHFSASLAVFNFTRLSRDKRRNTYMKKLSGWNGGIVNLEYYTRVQKHKKLVKQLIKEFK